ncbi:MAG: DVUA0089 family protein [Chthoniobacterales bacterium]
MLKKFFLFSALALAGAASSPGFVLEGPKWTPDRTVQMQLSLGGVHPLIDGFKSFNASAADALREWDALAAHLQFQPILSSPVVPASNDLEMSVFFSGTIFGDTFGSSTLAVTLISDRSGIISETDTIFNTVFHWDSYDGPLRPGIEDFHRVALHEFGHTLGLDHPDQAGQTVLAIMNSRESGIFTPQRDDIAGIEALYANGPAEQSPVPAPVLANISTRGLVGSGDNVLIGGFIVQGPGSATFILRAIGFSLSAQRITGALFDPVLTVYDSSQQQIAKSDDWTSSPKAATLASYHLDPPNTIESAVMLTLAPGEYTAVVEGYTDATHTSDPGIALFELYDLHTTAGRAGNISTRGQVLTGDKVLIGGFIIGGTDPKPVVVRALGPSLGVANALTDPTLELRDGNGTLLQSNNNWADGPDAAAIHAEGFAPPQAKESVLQATLNPGNYTVIVSGVNGATGIGLVEVYDLSQP